LIKLIALNLYNIYMAKMGLVLGVTLILGIGIFIGLHKGDYSNIQNSIAQLQAVSEVVTNVNPTPGPFDDLTIPYLRNRTYQSQLGELTPISSTARYTSYLTSYNSDGLKINGLLTIPAGETPEGGWPAVVFVHGYIAPTIYRTTEKYVEYVDYLARNGLVVFKIDLRGHDKSEGEAAGGYYDSGYVIDTLNARAALAQADFVDASKIGLWGHSMAGNVVLRSLAARPEISKAVIWAGAGYTYSDLQEYGIDDNSYRPPSQSTERARRRQLLRETHGDFDPNSDFWKKVAPTNYLGDLKGQIEIHHAVDDTVVGIEYSRNLVRLLDETSVPHQLFEYPSGGHNITGSSFSQAMRRTTDFLVEY
jgi:dipeptidyl aminopeptidase/acylaminoacyl peptidase